MAQHDYNIANQTGLEFRADLNELAEAIVTQNSGPTAPATTYAGMKWFDTSTSPPIEKRRNAANSAWETTLTEAGRTVAGAADVAAQRTALGLGTAATLNAGTSANNVVQLNSSGELPAVSGANLTNLPATGLAAASTAEAQAGTSNTVAITPLRMKEAQIRLGTAVNATSGTVVEFLGIPSWAKRVTVTISGLSTNGTARPRLQLGTSGGVETSGYVSVGAWAGSGSAGATSTSGFDTHGDSGAVYVRSGSFVFDLLSPALNTWALQGMFVVDGSAFVFLLNGAKSLSGTLDRVRVTTTNGTDSFDAGQVNIAWE